MTIEIVNFPIEQLWFSIVFCMFTRGNVIHPLIFFSMVSFFLTRAGFGERIPRMPSKVWNTQSGAMRREKTSWNWPNKSCFLLITFFFVYRVYIWHISHIINYTLNYTIINIHQPKVVGINPTQLCFPPISCPIDPIDCWFAAVPCAAEVGTGRARRGGWHAMTWQGWLVALETTDTALEGVYHLGVSENRLNPEKPNGFADQTIPMKNG